MTEKIANQINNDLIKRVNDTNILLTFIRHKFKTKTYKECVKTLDKISLFFSKDIEAHNYLFKDLEKNLNIHLVYRFIKEKNCSEPENKTDIKEKGGFSSFEAIPSETLPIQSPSKFKEDFSILEPVPTEQKRIDHTLYESGSVKEDEQPPMTVPLLEYFSDFLSAKNGFHEDKLKPSFIVNEPFITSPSSNLPSPSIDHKKGSVSPSCKSLKSSIFSGSNSLIKKAQDIKEEDNFFEKTSNFHYDKTLKTKKLNCYSERIAFIFDIFNLEFSEIYHDQTLMKLSKNILKKIKYDIKYQKIENKNYEKIPKVYIKNFLQKNHKKISHHNIDLILNRIEFIFKEDEKAYNYLFRNFGENLKNLLRDENSLENTSPKPEKKLKIGNLKSVEGATETDKNSIQDLIEPPNIHDDNIHQNISVYQFFPQLHPLLLNHHFFPTFYNILRSYTSENKFSPLTLTDINNNHPKSPSCITILSSQPLSQVSTPLCQEMETSLKPLDNVVSVTSSPLPFLEQKEASNPFKTISSEKKRVETMPNLSEEAHSFFNANKVTHSISLNPTVSYTKPCKTFPLKKS